MPARGRFCPKLARGLHAAAAGRAFLVVVPNRSPVLDVAPVVARWLRPAPLERGVTPGSRAPAPAESRIRDPGSQGRTAAAREALNSPRKSIFCRWHDIRSERLYARRP